MRGASKSHQNPSFPGLRNLHPGHAGGCRRLCAHVSILEHQAVRWRDSKPLRSDQKWLRVGLAPLIVSGTNQDVKRSRILSACSEAVTESCVLPETTAKGIRP